MVNTEKRQIDRLNEVLIDLKPDVTTEDKVLAAKKYKIHVVSVGRYLNGQGTDSDTTANLIFFFKDRIAQRDKVIA